MTSDLVYEVVAALAKHKNVLLYGPPGTGKTWLVSKILAYLRERNPSGGQPTIRLGSTKEQFGTAEGKKDLDDLPLKLHTEWVTFHQNYSYEEFMVGKHPKPLGAGIILEPHFGVLMSIAVSIDQNDGQDGCLLIIDEINRANASQVFGEFITLLDPEYRGTVGGISNTEALKITLPGIAYEGGKSEPISMLRGGGTYQLSENWTFPEHLYVLATMNSVDKAALPLDSALTRRFYRIEMRPNIAGLADELDIHLAALADKVKSIRDGNKPVDTLSAEETTVLLLDHLNISIASDMGEDFELGHSLVWKVVEADAEARWVELINVWDHTLLPQLVERYAGRDDGLKELLKVRPDSPTTEAFCDRLPIGAVYSENPPLKIKPLRGLPQEAAKNVLRQLAI